MMGVFPRSVWLSPVQMYKLSKIVQAPFAVRILLQDDVYYPLGDRYIQYPSDHEAIEMPNTSQEDTVNNPLIPSSLEEP